MRLLEVYTLKLHTFYGADIPRYVILSHNWGRDDEEVTFAQIQFPATCRHIRGYGKIKLLCDQAQRDGYQYAWIDTCCIDKSNSSELSEAINSMFSWYQRSDKCYAYLADIDLEHQDPWGGRHVLLESRWWKRAWTLQELLAPTTVKFFDWKWRVIGSKSDEDIAQKISSATSIDEEVLKAPESVFSKSVAQRMSWAAAREATRSEDLAYSLLGLFEINMPMQYGEGHAAFIRLQKEILRNTNDQTLFAWSPSTKSIEEVFRQRRARQSANVYELPSDNMLLGDNSSFGMFAPHPKAFKECQNIVFADMYASGIRVTEMNGAVYAKLPLVSPKISSRSSEHLRIGLLSCTATDSPDYMIGILLEPWSSDQRFQRVSLRSGSFTVLVKCKTALAANYQKIWIDDTRHVARAFQHQLRQTISPRRTILINGGKPSENLRLIASEPQLQTDLDATTLHMPRVRETRYDTVHLSFESITDVPIDPSYFFTVSLGLGTSLQQSEELKDRVSLSTYPMQDSAKVRYEKRLYQWPYAGDSNATLHIHGVRIDAVVASRLIFNHLITNVTITVDRSPLESLPVDALPAV